MCRPARAAGCRKATIISRCRKSRTATTGRSSPAQRAARQHAGPIEVVHQGAGRVRQSTPSADRPQDPSIVGLHYGIESFFVPEGTGRELEKMVGDKKIVGTHRSRRRRQRGHQGADRRKASASTRSRCSDRRQPCDPIAAGSAIFSPLACRTYRDRKRNLGSVPTTDLPENPHTGGWRDVAQINARIAACSDRRCGVCHSGKRAGQRPCHHAFDAPRGRQALHVRPLALRQQRLAAHPRPPRSAPPSPRGRISPDLEYGRAWARFSRAASKKIGCSRGGTGWTCDAEARPCR